MIMWPLRASVVVMLVVIALGAWDAWKDRHFMGAMFTAGYLVFCAVCASVCVALLVWP